MSDGVPVLVTILFVTLSGFMLSLTHGPLTKPLGIGWVGAGFASTLGVVFVRAIPVTTESPWPLIAWALAGGFVLASGMAVYISRTEHD